MYRKSRDSPLKSPNRVLCGPSQHTLSVVGKFVGNLKSDQISAKQEIYVVNGLQRPLLGRPAIESLKVAIQVSEILAQKDIIVLKFPHIFKGLGHKYRSMSER